MKKIVKIISISLPLLLLNFLNLVNASEKIKIGLLVPMTGKNKDLGDNPLTGTVFSYANLKGVELPKQLNGINFASGDIILFLDG